LSVTVCFNFIFGKVIFKRNFVCGYTCHASLVKKMLIFVLSTLIVFLWLGRFIRYFRPKGQYGQYPILDRHSMMGKFYFENILIFNVIEKYGSVFGAHRYVNIICC